MAIRIETKSIMALILLGILDALIPLPIIGLLLIVVILTKPPWFMDMVNRIYDESGQ